MRFAARSAVLVAVGVAAASPGGVRAEPPAPAPAWSGEMPAGLRLPAGHALAFEVQAEGVQVYACAASGGSFAWAFQGPEAKLLGPGGEPAGTHYAGPTWEANDGSKVVGAKVEGATPDPGAIPWLLLRATSHSGSGRMQQVTFVQRLQTSGGNAPAGGCDAAHAGAVARVPYRAVYRFAKAGTGG